jgi:competence protein ComEC
VITPRSIGHRAPLLWIALPLIGGLTAGRLGGIGPIGVQLAVALVAAVLAAVLAWREARGWAAALIVAMVLAGSASYEISRARLEVWESLPPREVRISIRIDRIFSITDPRKISGLGRVTHATGPLADLAGQRLYFSAGVRAGDPAPKRSAILAATGVLASLPRDPEPDSFEGYLASSGVNFRLNRARFTAEEQRQPAYYRFCDAAAARFNAILGEGIAAKRPALAGLLRAMMLGETRELTEEQHTIFMQSGTMHLFAISGLNIAVIAGALEALLGLLRLPQWVRFVAGTMLLWLFVDITGAAPSAVRAFAMAVFFRGAFVLQRPANAVAALIGSAVVVLLLQPMQLFSASFLMSYGIVLALLLLGLPLAETWLARWSPWRNVPPVTWTWWQRRTAVAWTWLATAVAIGVATALVGTLTSVQFFRLLTPGALVANLVLIPTAMLVTLGGFAALVCGLIGLSAGAVLCNHAAALALWVIEALVRQSVRLPWAFLPAHFRQSWVGSAALAAVLAVILAGYASGWRKERGGWWPPFAMVALALVLGVQIG